MAETGSGFIKLIGISLMLLACRSGTQKSAELTSQAPPVGALTMNEKPSKSAITGPGPVSNAGQVAPGSCRLVGQIVAIKSQLEPDKTTPCGKVPCKAMVKIRNIIAYGAAFKPPLAEGQEIPVYFPFTLSPTATFFPELNTPLPGLQVGSVFEAKVETAGESGNNTPDWYQVYTYSVK